MEKIAEFRPAITGETGRLGVVAYSTGSIVEAIGPAGNEKFCNLKKDSNGKISASFPHIDMFSNFNAYKNIVLTGRSAIYEIPIYKDFETSVKQYFLEHPTRDGIQYVFYNNGAADNTTEYLAMVPGLVIGDNGTVLGYLHSYVADFEGHVAFEIPYGESVNSYSFSGCTFDATTQENLINFNVESGAEVTVSNKNSGDSATVTLFACNSSSGTQTFEIKNVNEFADYIIAAQLTDGTINNVLRELDTVVFYNSRYYPKRFATLKLYTSCESAKNMTPSIYKVPAALVNNGNKKVFMTDVTGIATNRIIQD